MCDPGAVVGGTIPPTIGAGGMAGIVWAGIIIEDCGNLGGGGRVAAIGGWPGGNMNCPGGPAIESAAPQAQKAK